MIFLKGKSVLNVNVAWEPDTELMHGAFCSTCDPLSQHSIIHIVQQVCKPSADLAIPPKEHCVMELSDPVQTIFSSSYLVFMFYFFYNLWHLCELKRLGFWFKQVERTLLFWSQSNSLYNANVTLTETFRLCIIMGTLLTAGDFRSLTANLIGFVCLAPYFLLRTCPLLLSLWGIAFVFLIEAQRASVEMHLHRLHLSVRCAGDDCQSKPFMWNLDRCEVGLTRY